MASQTDIVNLALYYIAQSVVIPTMIDESKAADVANRLWDPTLDFIQTMRPWSFLREARALGLSAGDPQPGWAFRYQYPNDCLRAWALTDLPGLSAQPNVAAWCDGWGARVDSWRYRWQKARGRDGTVIDANVEQAWLIFTIRETDASRFPPMFVQAFARLLAQMMAPPLIGDVGLNAQNGLQNAFAAALQEASAHDGNESGSDFVDDTPSLRARG
jgi:hypothetical protein